MFFCGAMAGAEVEGVIGVHAVGGRGESALLRESIEYGEQFVLTEKTTIGSVGAIGGIVHFVRFHELMMNVLRLDEVLDYVAIVSGIAGRKRGYRQGAIAEGALGGPGEVGGVGAAREGDDYGGDIGQLCQKLALFFFGGSAGRFYRM